MSDRIVGYIHGKRVSIFEGFSGWLVRYHDNLWCEGPFVTKQAALDYVGPLAESPNEPVKDPSEPTFGFQGTVRVVIYRDRSSGWVYKKSNDPRYFGIYPTRLEALQAAGPLTEEPDLKFSGIS